VASNQTNAALNDCHRIIVCIASYRLTSAVALVCATIVEEHGVLFPLPIYLRDSCVGSFDICRWSLDVLHRLKVGKQVKVVSPRPVSAHADPEVLTSTSNKVSDGIAFSPFEEVVVTTSISNSSAKGNDIDLVKGVGMEFILIKSLDLEVAGQGLDHSVDALLGTLWIVSEDSDCRFHRSHNDAMLLMVAQMKMIVQGILPS
jgi:hypothetical protein